MKGLLEKRFKKLEMKTYLVEFDCTRSFRLSARDENDAIERVVKVIRDEEHIKLEVPISEFRVKEDK